MASTPVAISPTNPTENHTTASIAWTRIGRNPPRLCPTTELKVQPRALGGRRDGAASVPGLACAAPCGSVRRLAVRSLFGYLGAQLIFETLDALLHPQRHLGGIDVVLVRTGAARYLRRLF